MADMYLVLDISSRLGFVVACSVVVEPCGVLVLASVLELLAALLVLVGSEGHVVGVVYDSTRAVGLQPRRAQVVPVEVLHGAAAVLGDVQSNGVEKMLDIYG